MTVRAAATKGLPATAPAAGAISEEMAKQYAQYTGAGKSSDQADNMVPLVYILQPLSPQVEKRKEQYIEGAEAGMFWLRNSSHALISGDDGMEFQHCYFYKEFVEWVPRDDGGGFVGRHGFKMEGANEVPDVDDAIAQTDEVTGQTNWVRKNGNDLVLTRNHVGYALLPSGPEPYIIPFTSTGHTVSRGWMQKMNMQRWPGGIPAPAFAFTYRLTTRLKTNKAGSWFQIAVDDGRPLTDKVDLDRGVNLHDAFASGEKKAAEPVAPGAEPAGGKDGAGVV